MRGLICFYLFCILLATKDYPILSGEFLFLQGDLNHNALYFNGKKCKQGFKKYTLVRYVQILCQES